MRSARPLLDRGVPRPRLGVQDPPHDSLARLAARYVGLGGARGWGGRSSRARGSGSWIPWVRRSDLPALVVGTLRASTTPRSSRGVCISPTWIASTWSTPAHVTPGAGRWRRIIDAARQHPKDPSRVSRRRSAVGLAGGGWQHPQVTRELGPCGLKQVAQDARAERDSWVVNMTLPERLERPCRIRPHRRSGPVPLARVAAASRLDRLGASRPSRRTGAVVAGGGKVELVAVESPQRRAGSRPVHRQAASVITCRAVSRPSDRPDALQEPARRRQLGSVRRGRIRSWSSMLVVRSATERARRSRVW